MKVLESVLRIIKKIEYLDTPRDVEAVVRGVLDAVRENPLSSIKTEFEAFCQVGDGLYEVKAFDGHTELVRFDVVDWGWSQRGEESRKRIVKQLNKARTAEVELVYLENVALDLENEDENEECNEAE